jgi:Na+-translocating ferredoxin:NAD+ oxidoreductase subunit C
MSTIPSTPIPHSSLWPAEPPALRRMDSVDRLFIPLSPRGDPSAKPPGTQVHPGQPVVERADELSHIPIAPLSGTLGSVVEVTLTNGKKSPAVELLVNRKDPTEPRSVEGATNDLVGWIDRIRRAGVAADRQSSPDLIRQLTMAVSRPIEWVIVTALDTDSGLRLNAVLAARYADRVAAAAELIGRLTQARSVCVAMESFAAPQWAMPMRAACRAERIQIVDLENDYPQSDPTLMLYTVAERRFRPGEGILPVGLGVLLMDAAAALQIGQVRRGRAARFIPVGIHDHIQEHSHLLSVPVGTRLSDLLAELSIPTAEVILRGGDLLRDKRLTPDVILAGGELTVHIAPKEMLNNPEPCVRCGWCLEACPTRVQPARILDAAQRNDPEMAEQGGLHACIECGLCSHVCPSRLPLLQAIQQMRSPNRKI